MFDGLGRKRLTLRLEKAARERSEKRVASTNAEVSKLMDQIVKLKAENAQLKRENEKYAAMKAVLLETGYQPR